MIGESKPNFALDLSNDGVALWYRASGGSWDSLGSVSLDAPDFSEQVAALRNKANGGSSARARSTVIRIPRSEVMLDKVRLGVFEGEAAERHALKQIAQLTPYSLDEIAFDLGDKGFGNMAPVGVVANQTLLEAESFARANGFEPTYFTTQYSSKEFPREPRFYLAKEASKSKGLWFVPWVAAASVGLTIGYFGFSYLTSPDPSQKVPVAQVEQIESPTPVVEANPVVETAALETKVAQPEPVETVQLGLQDIAPNLPPVLVALNAPNVTNYPELLTASVQRAPDIEEPKVVRLAVPEAHIPLVSVSSKEIKTSNLQIEEAHRDLPEVAVNAEIVDIIQSDLAVLSLDLPAPNPPMQIASLTLPTQTPTPNVIGTLPSSKDFSTGVSTQAATPALRPPKPPSLVTAEPGTLTPTPDGTLGPDNILIYSGPPPKKSRIRPGTPIPEPDPLAGFRPRLRPEGLVPQEQLLASQEVATQPTILDLADPALRPLRPLVRPENLVVVETLPTQQEIVDEPSILALADPSLRPLRPRLRPENLVDDALEAEIIVAAIANDAETQEPVSLIDLADPALKPFRPRIRPQDFSASVDLIAVAIQQDTIAQGTEQQNESSLLALADPSLVGKKAKSRPSNLQIIDSQVERGLLALADPTLSGKKAKSRPQNLRVIREPEPVAEPEKTADPEIQNTIASATKQAIARSPKPKSRPAKLARVAKRVQANDAKLDSGGTTKASAKTPKSARGTSKPAPGPTATTVARAATEKTKFRKSRMSLVGVFGTPNERRALVRLPSGRYVKVQKGDRVSGWKVSAIGESSLRIKKGSRDQVLRMP